MLKFVIQVFLNTVLTVKEVSLEQLLILLIAAVLKVGHVQKILVVQQHFQNTPPPTHLHQTIDLILVAAAAMKMKQAVAIQVPAVVALAAVALVAAEPVAAAVIFVLDVVALIAHPLDHLNTKHPLIVVAMASHLEK